MKFSRGYYKAAIQPLSACLVVLVLVLFPQRTPAQSCMDEVTGRENTCTALDVRIFGLWNESNLVCESGTTIDLTLTVGMRAEASERWDVGFFFALDGGDALTGACALGYLPPPVASGGTCDLTGGSCNTALDCSSVGLCDDGSTACNTDFECPPAQASGRCFVTGGVCSSDNDCFNDPAIIEAADACVGYCSGGQSCFGGYDPLSPVGPYYDGEADVDPSDVCGDLEQDVPSYTTVSLSVPCTDSSGDGLLDIASCVSWDNSRSNGSINAPSCNGAEDTYPNTSARCNCELTSVQNVYVRECGNLILEEGEECDGGACCSETCELQPAVCDDGFFCNGEEICSAGTCESGRPPDCGDGVSCTDDACDENSDSCVNAPNDSYCDDGLWCNGAETCDPAADCQAGIEPCALGEICDEVAKACDLPTEVSIDIKFCGDPNSFNCKGKGVLPITVFGTDEFDVGDIDVSSLQLCLEDLSACTDAPVSWSIADRGDPNSDLGAAQCAFVDTDGDGVPEEQYFLNLDGFLDLDATFFAREVAAVLGDFCNLGKGTVSQPFIVTGTTLDGTEIFSVPFPNVGVDQLVKTNR